MLWILLFFAGIFIGLLYFNYTKDSADFMCIFLISVLASTVGLGLSTAIFRDDASEPNLKDYYLMDEKPIYSLNNDTTFKGNFFLGGGKIENAIVYYYITEDSCGKKVEHVSANESRIVEASGDFSVKHYYKPIKIEFLILEPSQELFIFYCPKDSITYNYSIDLN